MPQVTVMLCKDFQNVRTEKFIKDLTKTLTEEIGMTVGAQVSSAVCSSPVCLQFYDMGGFDGKRANEIMESAKPIVYRHFGVVEVEITMNATLKLSD